MTAAAQRLAALLPDFGMTGMMASVPSRPAQPATSSVASAKPKQPDIAALIADAVLQAEATLRQKLEAEHQAQVAAIHTDYAAECEALRAQAAQREVELVDVKLGFLQTYLVETLTDATGQVLAQALAEPLQSQALEAFTEALAELVANENAIRIEIAAPADLTLLLKERLKGQSWNVIWREAESLDITASCNGQVVGTRLGEWTKTLSGLFS